MDNRLKDALATVGEALAGIDADSIAAACRMIASADKIGIYGCGREGYQMRGFAMRLFHLGFRVGFVGDTTMPPLGAGDLLVVSSGPGALATVNAHATTARSAGAAVVLVTAEPNAPAVSDADLVLTVPSQTMASESASAENSILPMGSVYEGALFFLFEKLGADLKDVTGETSQSMRARHTNME